MSDSNSADRRRPAMSDKPEPIGPERRSGLRLPLLFFMGLAVLALLLFVRLRGGGGREASREEAALLGQTLSRVELQPLTGDPLPVDLASLRGKVTLINFWGTWCPPCVEEFPALYRLQKDLAASEEFQFVSVSCWPQADADVDELREETAAFLKARSATDLPTYHDPGAVTRTAVLEASSGAGFGYPTTLLIDREGVIRGAWFGYLAGMEREIEHLTRSVLKK